MSWVDDLLPGSWRGVPFEADRHSEDGGRRVALFEFPDRDLPATQPLGRKAGTYQVTMFVLGPDYMTQRDALRAALQLDGSIGTLQHPWLGVMRLRPGVMKMTESKDEGGMARFDVTFHEPGIPSSPISSVSTASSVLAGLATAFQLIEEAYVIGVAIAKNPALIGGLLEGALTSFATAFLGAIGIPGGLTSGILSLVGGLTYTSPTGGTAATTGSTSTPTAYTPASTASAVTSLVSATADAIVAQGLVTPTAADPVAGSVPTVTPSDQTMGLITLATWTPGQSGTAVTAASVASLAAAQGLVLTPSAVTAAVQSLTALTVLVQGAVTAAIASIYAQATWTSANAAQAAAAQLGDLLDTQLQAAADADNDTLYLAWQGVSTLAIADLNQRAQQLPQLVSYTMGASLPSLTLAQRLYQDGSRADGLAALNDVVCPLFMPPAGVALAS